MIHQRTSLADIDSQRAIQPAARCGNDGEDGVQDFFAVFAGNMQDLGSPVHGQSFFHSILKTFHKQAAILLVRDGTLTIGAACCLFLGDTVSISWVSSLRPYFGRCPNQVLYWEAMRYGIGQGYRFLNVGRSTRGETSVGCRSGTTPLGSLGSTSRIW